MQFSDQRISIATAQDIPSLKDLLNLAYRGEEAKKGWTSEAHLIAGDTRTDENELDKLLKQPGSLMLKWVDADRIDACVNLQQKDNSVYLGMLSVSPLAQGAGIGKKLLKAAEEFAASQKCDRIYMTVITLRTELINWYKRHGYVDTGERKPFVEDAISGKHLQPLEFMVLEKLLHAKSISV
ncbi:MAG: GNAT family N-acetyltransferase [Chitinophagaceae bacterium]